MYINVDDDNELNAIHDIFNGNVDDDSDDISSYNISRYTFQK